GKLFGTRHYHNYHFLLTLSNHVAHFGLEHHESNDSRAEERGVVSPQGRRGVGGLLSHEFVHFLVKQEAKVKQGARRFPLPATRFSLRLSYALAFIPAFTPWGEAPYVSAKFVGSLVSSSTGSGIGPFTTPASLMALRAALSIGSMCGPGITSSGSVISSPASQSRSFMNAFSSNLYLAIFIS
ncbi:MAG: hypothetical protein ACLP56_24440, partial [Candidatus Sulfotelmatobacter sp.]